MSGNIAINPETGEMLIISPQGQWVPPQRARNPETGAEVFYDGAGWRPVPAARTAPAAPAPTAESVGRGFFERNIFDPVERGYQQTMRGIAATRGRSPDSFYGLYPEDAASEIIQRTERLAQIPQTAEVQRVNRAAEESGSVLGAVGQYARSPEAIANITGESIGANPVGGALGAVGAALPVPFLRQIVGALAGAMNFPTEYASSIGESLLEAARDQGIDPTNRQQLAGLIRAMNADPALMEKTKNDALLRAGIISAADAAAGGLAGRMAGRGFAGRVGGGAAVEGAGGGLGEAGAQLATEGQISPAEIGAEIVGSGVGGGLGNLTRAGAPPAGPRTREEDENLRTAIDTVTGERDYLDGTRNPPASAPAPTIPAEPSSQGILPEVDGQQQAAPIVPPTNQAHSFNIPEGTEFPVRTPDGSMSVNVVPQIVDLGSLIPASGDFQNRNTSNKANQATIASIANAPDFFYLGTSQYADRGAPIVGPDNMVEVGNHRVMGLKRAAETNPEGFANYVKSLQNAGYDTKGMTLPVLIRRRVTGIDDSKRIEFVRLANKEANQSFNALETAKEDASKITPELIAQFDGEVTGGIRAAKNLPFVRKFLSEILTKNEFNKASTDEAGISDALEVRIKNALFAHAYKNPQLLAKVTERGTDDSKTITNGLIGATGAMEGLRRGIETDRIRPEFDVIDAIVAASDRLRDAKANGIELSRVLDTEDMVTPLTDLDKAATRLLLNEKQDGIASASLITRRLKAYAEDAKTQTPDKDLVGGERRVTPEEALTKALTPGQTSMFSARNVPTEEDVDVEAESGERKTPPEVERALALIKARLDSLRAKGKQGAALAKALEDALANRNLSADQIYAAFTVDDAILQAMPKGANYEFQFLHDLVVTDKDAAEKAGVKLGTKLQGMKVSPAREGLPGLIQLSLADDMLPLLNETAFHEAFHVLQDYFSAYDKGFKAAIGKHFKDGMKLSDLEPSIKRRLQAMKPPGSEQSYWDSLVGGLGEGEIKHGYEAQAYAFGALADAAMRGEKVVGLLPPFQRFFNFLRDTMAALRSGFTGDGFRTPASLLGGAVDRAAKYNQQAPRTAGQSYSAQQINTPAFQRWFGDSKVVDANGSPMSVFHGTPTGGFDSFDTNKAGRNIDSGYLGTGFYFTDGTNIANYYAASGAQESPTVYPVYLSIKNPFMWGKKTQGVRGLSMRGANLPGDLTEAVLKRAGVERDRLGENYEPYNDPFLEPDLSRALREELIARGYDGVIAGENTGPKEYVAFRPEQIKSAIGNSGAFDPNDSRIQFSARNVQNDLFTPTAASKPDPIKEGYINTAVKDRNAEVVYQDDNIALLNSYSVVRNNFGRSFGKQYYSAINLDNGRWTPTGTDIEDYTGSAFFPHQVDFLVKKKKEHQDKVKNITALNPRGPFKGNSNIAFDVSFPNHLRGFAEGLLNELGMKDVPVFFTDVSGVKDARFVSRNNLFGQYVPFRRLQTLGEGVYGVAQSSLPFAATVAISTDGVRKSIQIEALAHEIGHVFDGHILKKADKATQDAVMNAFIEWRKKHIGLPAVDYIKALRSAMVGRTLVRGLDPSIKAQTLNSYFKEFEEWFADQVAKWGTTSAPAQSLIGRFFQRIAAAYRKIVSAIGKSGLPDQTVADFIENHRKMQNTVSIFSAPPIPAKGSKKPTQATFQFSSSVVSLNGEETPQFSARKAPPKPTVTQAAGTSSVAGNAKAFYNTAVTQTNKPNPFSAVLGYMFDKKPGETISGAIARTSINAAAPLHNFHAMASKNGYTGLSAGQALELQMSNSGRINQLLNAGMGRLNAKTGEITFRKDVKPLLQIIGEADIGDDKTKKGWLQTYLIALRDRDLRKVGRQVFTNMSDKQVDDTIKYVEMNYPKFKQTAADLDKLNKALIEFALEAGLISPSHAKTLASRFYSPAYREEFDRINNALNVQLTGSDKSLNDLYSNIILNADSIMKASLKNVAMKTAAETMKFANVGRVNTSGKKNRETTITYRDGGKEVDFDIDDPVLYSALTTLPRETIHGIYQAMARTASFFRDAITVAPSFIFKNLLTGKISAYVQEGAPLLTNTLGGVRDALKNTTTLQNFQMQTGFGGMEWGMKPKDMVKTFERKLTDKGMMNAISKGHVYSALRQGFGKLQALSEASEMAERIKLSEGLIKQGMSPRDAYFQAYLIAPYSRKGTGQGFLGHTVQFLAPLIPFLNAKLQTTYRILENEKGDKRKLWTFGLPQQIFLRGLVLTAFSTAVYGLNLQDDEDEWDSLPNYVKLNYDVIPFTSGIVTIPRAYEIGQIFGALPVFALDAIRRGEGRDLTEAMIQVARSTLFIDPIPKAIEPIIGAVANYDFFRKQPLVSAGEQALPIAERVRRSTTETAKGVSAVFNSVFGDNLSPIQAQSVLEGYTGTVGTMIMAGFDSILAATGAIPSKPAGAFGDPLSMPAIIASVTGADRLYREREGITSRFVNDFYRIKEMTDQLVRSQTLATDARDYERLQELRGEEGLPLRMRPAVNAASTQIAALNKRIRLIEGGQLDGVSKTEAIQPLIAQRDRIARRVVDQARNLGVF